MPATLDFLPDHDRLRTSRPRNAMSVDVEEYFQVAAFEQRVKREDWAHCRARVAETTFRVLDMFEQRSTKATFFVLGWVAEREPALIRRIVGDGHELASHGYDHTRIHNFGPTEFRADVVRTKSILEDIGGVRILGYRAPSYSINARNLWALDVLQETGHVYSSSIYPIRHDLYGMPEAPRFAFRVRKEGILELPVTTVRVAGRNFPCGGGGYFRLLPYPLFRWALRSVATQDCQPSVFYFHPWEIDPGQPRIDGLPLRSRFRHYVNLSTMQGRLDRLLREFDWGRMDEVFDVSAAVRSAA